MIIFGVYWMEVPYPETFPVGCIVVVVRQSLSEMITGC